MRGAPAIVMSALSGSPCLDPTLAHLERWTATLADVLATIHATVVDAVPASKRRLDVSMIPKNAVMRVARPTDHLDAIGKMYVAGLGFEILGSLRGTMALMALCLVTKIILIT